MRPPTTEHEPTALELAWANYWVRAVTYVALSLFLAFVLWRFRANYVFALQVGVLGFVLAYILNPLVGLLQRARIGRKFAVVIVYFLVLVLLALGSLLISQVVLEAGKFATLVPDAFENLSRWATSAQAWFAGVMERLPGFLSDRLGVVDPDGNLAEQIQGEVVLFLQQLGRGFADLLERIAAGGPGLLLSGATAVISTTVQIVLIVLAGAYFLYDFPRFTANFARFVPVRYRALTSDLAVKADLAVGGYVRGQLLITLCIGLMIWLGLMIIGVPLATSIAFLAAIFNLVPYLGPIVGALPAIVLGLTVSPLTAVLAIVVFLIANQVEGNLLSPLILARSTNLHPVTVLLAIMIGFGFFGFVGALLAVPTAALGKVVLEEYLLKRPAFTGDVVVQPALDQSADSDSV